MVKCPHCGSTAQVKVLIGDNLNNIWVGSMGHVSQILVCGCGCQFVRQFTLDKECVINEKRGEIK